MQTFRDFLLERTQAPEQVAQALLSQCMPYINAIGEVEHDNVLYRGTDAKIEDFVARERKEAGGVTSNYANSSRGQMIQNYFAKKYGINLDAIIFTTADLSVARTFGNPYVVFPIGPFKFVYSKTGIALPNINTEADLQKANFVYGIANDTSDDGLPDPDFQNAVRSNNEILIQASGYLPLSLAYWKANGQAILEELSFR